MTTNKRIEDDLFNVFNKQSLVMQEDNQDLTMDNSSNTVNKSKSAKVILSNYYDDSRHKLISKWLKKLSLCF